MPTNKETTHMKTHINDNLPVLYVDDVDANHRDDGINYLSFTAHLPKQVVEQVRLIIEDENLEEIIHYLCRLIDYYPTKTGKKAGKASK